MDLDSWNHRSVLIYQGHHRNVSVIRCTGQSGMAGERPRAEGLRHRGRRQSPHQSVGGASKMDEKEPGKSVSGASSQGSISVRLGFLVHEVFLSFFIVSGPLN